MTDLREFSAKLRNDAVAVRSMCASEPSQALGHCWACDAAYRMKEAATKLSTREADWLRAREEQWKRENPMGATVITTERVRDFDTVTDLQQECDRLREALTAIHQACRTDFKGEWWTLRKWLDARGIFNGDVADERLFEEVARAALAPQDKETEQ